MFKLLRSKFSLTLFVSSLLLLGLALLLTDPFNLSMNNMMLVILSGLVFACFAVFAGLLWKEKPSDEREAVLIDQAGKFAYITGMSTLVLAIIVQSFQHNVDVWIVIVLSVMVLSKHFYIQIKK